MCLMLVLCVWCLSYVSDACLMCLINQAVKFHWNLQAVKKSGSTVKNRLRPANRYGIDNVDNGKNVDNVDSVDGVNSVHGVQSVNNVLNVTAAAKLVASTLLTLLTLWTLSTLSILFPHQPYT